MKYLPLKMHCFAFWISVSQRACFPPFHPILNVGKLMWDNMAGKQLWCRCCAFSLISRGDLQRCWTLDAPQCSKTHTILGIMSKIYPYAGLPSSPLDCPTSTHDVVHSPENFYLMIFLHLIQTSIVLLNFLAFPSLRNRHMGIPEPRTLLVD